MSALVRTTAKFRGSCPYCRRPINPGDVIGYDRDRKQTVCGPCEESDRLWRGMVRQVKLLDGLKLA